MAESVVLQLTGVPQLRVGTRVCVLDRLSAVVAARLALEGPQPRSLLAALLWPDVEAARARANLRQRLLRLKQQAGVDWIGGQAKLVLAHGVTVEPIDDAHAADLLQGLTLDAQEELSQWLDAARESQRRQRLQALAALAQSAEADRRWADAIACVRLQLALEPLDESHHHALVRLLYLSGDLAQARIAHARCVDLLRHELGLQPGPALLDLADLIQRAAPAVAVRGPLPALLRPPQLQGRGSDLRLLSRVVAEGAGPWCWPRPVRARPGCWPNGPKAVAGLARPSNSARVLATSVCRMPWPAAGCRPCWPARTPSQTPSGGWRWRR